MLSAKLFRRIGAITAILLAFGLAVSAQTTSLRGQLEPSEDGQPLRLRTAAGESVELALDESGLEKVLRDPQLATRDWELRGRETEDGRFVVERVFTVKDGQLHRVTYYCEICHITTHEPGPCMCCQGVTDLRELPGE